MRASRWRRQPVRQVFEPFSNFEAARACSVRKLFSANLHTGLVFLDIKKAFDTVSHDILIQKLEHYGIRGIANDLFNSYLRSRKQFVMVDEIEHSDLFQIKSEVPQGSTLGPFFIFVLH